VWLLLLETDHTFLSLIDTNANLLYMTRIAQAMISVLHVYQIKFIRWYNSPSYQVTGKIDTGSRWAYDL